jgi:ribosome biogenesis protein MAK21
MSCMYDSLLRLGCRRFWPQESVTANMRSLDQLLGWAGKRGGGKELVRQAVEALQELFVGVLLPNRKLRFLEQQPLAVRPVAG